MTKNEIKARLEVLYTKREQLKEKANDPWKKLDDEYGDDRDSMREDDLYKELVKEAKGLIEKMFTTFKSGGDWIKSQHENGRKNYMITNVMGMNRHLWGYAHNDKALHRRVDRQGPNSVIQGPSSNINSLAGPLFKRYAFKLKKAGRDVQ